MVERYDDIVLGGGKGGKSLAMELGPAGHKVALIERGQIGGTCINVACIPTKTLVTSAKLLHHAKHSQNYGLDLSINGNSLQGAIGRKRKVVKGMVDAHWKLFESTANMDLIVGVAKFVGHKVIEVDTTDGEKRQLTAERIVINTGSQPMIPNIEGLQETGYLTSTSIMELETLPEHLVIIGGGYIALEFAQIFKRLGSEVTVLLRSAKFLPKEDADIASIIKDILEEEGIRFLSEAETTSIKRIAPDKIELQLLVQGKVEKLEATSVLVASGRSANNDQLNVSATGLTLTKRGHIAVNERLETEVEGIFAIGDCNGGPHFTHVSWDDYRILRDNILHNAKRTTEGRLVPYTLFIDPELGRVGLTEEEARSKGYDISVAKIPAAKIPRANTAGETKGILKAVIDRKTDLILGCSILSYNGGEIMSVIQTAMLGKLPYQAVRDIIFTHPTMAESLNLLFSSVAPPLAATAKVKAASDH